MEEGKCTFCGKDRIEKKIGKSGFCTQCFREFTEIMKKEYVKWDV
jgi:DNA-directed RNA polymerase subunit RPC12/RpoP